MKQFTIKFIIFFIIYSCLLMAIERYKSLPLNKRYKYKKTDSKSTIPILDKLIKQNKKIGRLLNPNQDKLFIVDNTSPSITSGSLFTGVLQNKVISSDLSSPMIIKIVDSHFPKENPIVICSPNLIGSRIGGSCEKLITGPDEFSIQVIILGKDGVKGAKAETVNSENQIVTNTILSSSGFALSEVSNSLSQQKLSSSRTLSKVIEEISNSIPKSKEVKEVFTLYPGQQVILFFERSLKL